MNHYCRNCGCVAFRMGCGDGPCVDCGSPEVISEDAATRDLLAHVCKDLPEQTRQRLEPVDVFALCDALQPYLNIQDAILNGPLALVEKGQ
jgi:hypothetical protein